MLVTKGELSDVLQELPNAEPLSIQDSPDIFICTLGFEDRTHSIISQLRSSGYMSKTRLLVVEYPTNEQENQKNLNIFTEAASTMARHEFIKFERRSFVNKLRSQLEPFKDCNNLSVYFDISTCSSYVFYPTIHELMKMNIDLTIVYSEADIYYPTLEEWHKVDKDAQEEHHLFVQAFENAKFQSEGVSEIYSYSPYSEFNPGSKPSVLVAIPNFSVKRMNAIVNYDAELNKTQREDIVWLVGEPPSDHNKWRMDAVKITNSLNNVCSKSVSTFDYKDIIKSLYEIWDQYKYTHHMTVGSLGSKLQHLGTYFFLSLHREIGLWLAEPQEFKADRFSEGHGSCWQLKFGATGKIRELIDSYRTFKWKF